MVFKAKKQLQRTPRLYNLLQFLKVQSNVIICGFISPFRRYWFQRKFHIEYKNKPYLPRIGMHTTFIAKENILFLEEWILYHKSLGVEYFFLYDNSTVQVTEHGFGLAGAKVGKIAKRGVPYGIIVTMSDDDIENELDRIQREIPNVCIIPWAPVDKNGNICFAQSMCQTLAANKHKDTVDWMLFMDIDEYLVPSVDLNMLCTQMMEAGDIGATFWEHKMDNRYNHLDKQVCEITHECSSDHFESKMLPKLGKIICYIPRINSINIHSFQPVYPSRKFTYDEIYYRHYKCHHTGEPLYGASSLNFRVPRGPEWKLDRVSQDWRQLMDITKGNKNNSKDIELLLKNYYDGKNIQINLSP